MIEILPAPPQVAAFRFDGMLTADDYDRCIAEIETRLSRHPRIGLYCDMRGFSGITPPALARDLRYSLGKIGEYHRFARGAIVTGQAWLGAVSEFAGRFFPQTEIRAFVADEAAQAMAWVAAVEPGAAPG